MNTILYEDITTNELYTKMELQELWENMWCCYITDEYFVCSVGNVSEKQLRKYIENQG